MSETTQCETARLSFWHPDTPCQACGETKCLGYRHLNGLWEQSELIGRH